jgi:hypothetical protein
MEDRDGGWRRARTRCAGLGYCAPVGLGRRARAEVRLPEDAASGWGIEQRLFAIRIRLFQPGGARGATRPTIQRGPRNEILQC